MIDGHMHLEFGPLDKEYVMQFIQSAYDKGIEEIQILDHTHRFQEFEVIYENLKQEPIQKEWLANKEMKFKSTLEEYINLIHEVKAMDLPIKVSFGLEVCYVPEMEETIKEILSSYSFDFLVGAIHSIDGILNDMKFSLELLWEKYPAKHIYERYYALLMQLIESDLFTQVAHPDTIKLYQIDPSYDLTPTYQNIAKAMKKHHLKAENNTGCHYRYHHPDVGLSDTFKAILLQEGVEIINCSDAHKPEHVGMCFNEIK